MANAKSKTNWFAIGVSIAVVVVLVVLGGVVVYLNNQATAPDAINQPQSSVVDEKSGAITYGKGETTVDTYVDFMCPICGQFEDAYGAALQQAAADDKITLNLHPISILDRASQGTEFSTRSAASVYCVADANPDATLDYFNLLFKNQPAEGSTGLTDDQLADLAKQAGAEKAASCIKDGTYKGFVTEQTTKHDVKGTPTVDINGKRLDNKDIAAELAKILG
ncbi:MULTISPECIES: thioredoxin domain-containing protein [unclassified Microbacterium]|uniref:DsbA family protein n=1 Tax=unclassified Microbacterium TaxID=2609290 RepID=UPI0012FC3FFE|nr:thioredoxin domain-containing protein [Microbacterium sp. MAH-37]MVQ40804.1 thioredoxin domain-containing protein [Microbacterium sp. MAH-37]